MASEDGFASSIVFSNKEQTLEELFEKKMPDFEVVAGPDEPTVRSSMK